MKNNSSYNLGYLLEAVKNNIKANEVLIKDMKKDIRKDLLQIQHNALKESYNKVRENLSEYSEKIK